jgi:hypothetical protein
VFETIGPPLVAFALRFCGDAGRSQRRDESNAATASGTTIATAAEPLTSRSESAP